MFTRRVSKLANLKPQFVKFICLHNLSMNDKITLLKGATSYIFIGVIQTTYYMSLYEDR